MESGYLGFPPCFPGAGEPKRGLKAELSWQIGALLSSLSKSSAQGISLRSQRIAVWWASWNLFPPIVLFVNKFERNSSVVTKSIKSL